MGDKRYSGRTTPLRGSPLGKVVLVGREHTDKIIKPVAPIDFHHQETVCGCGLPFPEHEQDELDYISEHGRCKRVARKE